MARRRGETAGRVECCLQADWRRRSLLTSIESRGGRVLARHSVVVVVAVDQQVPADAAAADDALLCYDYAGAPLLVPARHVQRHDDPAAQPWCHPVPLAANQAALLLRDTHPGCFLVYRTDDDARYQLAVCVDRELVVHYDIVGPSSLGDYALEGDRRRFLSVSELVSYYQQNAGALATRLGRPLRDAACALRDAACPPHHLVAHVELDRERLHIAPPMSVIGGGGGGAEVWAGTYDGRAVAVKVLHDAAPASRWQVDDAFVGETSALVALRHDSVVRLVGVSSTSRPLLIITERHGASLKAALRASRVPASQRGRGRRAQLLDVALQLAAGVTYLASLRYVLHRAVSASAFVVCTTAGHCGPRVKLTDFSRARRVSADDSYTADGSELVAVKWAAPEVLSQLHYSSRSDVWALAVVLWQVTAPHTHTASLFLSLTTMIYRQHHCLEFYYRFSAFLRYTKLSKPNGAYHIQPTVRLILGLG